MYQFYKHIGLQGWRPVRGPKGQWGTCPCFSSALRIQAVFQLKIASCKLCKVLALRSARGKHTSFSAEGNYFGLLCLFSSFHALRDRGDRRRKNSYKPPNSSVSFSKRDGTKKQTQFQAWSSVTISFSLLENKQQILIPSTRHKDSQWVLFHLVFVKQKLFETLFASQLDIYLIILHTQTHPCSFLQKEIERRKTAHKLHVYHGWGSAS